MVLLFVCEYCHGVGIVICFSLFDSRCSLLFFFLFGELANIESETRNVSSTTLTASPSPHPTLLSHIEFVSCLPTPYIHTYI